MKRRVLAAGVVVAVIAAFLLWKARGGEPAAEATTGRDGVSMSSQVAGTKRADPRKLERASIAGTITDSDHKPIAGAHVCADASTDKVSAELVRDPRCTQTDAAGHYTIGELYAAEYQVAALARPYRPDAYHPGGDRDRTLFELRAGEKKTGIDIVLEKGGVEITGTVADISGGPIAHALVRASSGRWRGSAQYPAIETDETGKFSMYVPPGQVTVSAFADGYADGQDSGRAPGKLEILLVPESSLAGTVIDAKTGQPVAGVTVGVATSDFAWGGDDASDLSDDAGHFRVTRLSPGRYSVTARTAHGYGRGEGSTLVGLGQHVTGVVVKLYPAYQIAGRVVLPDGKTCKESALWVHSVSPQRYVFSHREPDGTLHADGVLPGTYEVTVECDGYQSKDKYPPIVIKDKDVLGVEWQVEAGATIKGRVVTKTGTPVEHASVSAQSIGGDARGKKAWGGDTSQKDGSYRLRGMKPGTYKLDVDSDQGVGPKDGWKIDVKSDVVQDLVLDDVGTIKGTVVDAEGKPIGGVHVDARTIDHGRNFWWGGPTVRSNDDGTFTLEGNRAGEYRVFAHRGEWGEELRKPGTDDDAKQGERVSVVAGQTATVRLVVEAQSGTIKGTCVDAAGKPVTDAFVTAARESDAAGNQRSSIADTRWSADDRPELTGTDGAFTLKNLSHGAYTVRAFRKGGGEAYVEHVALGTKAQIVFKPTAELAGLAHRDGGAPDELDISIKDPKTQFERSEHFFKTDGRFAIKDLPAGHFTITATAEGGQKQTEVDLADGQTRSDIDIVLDPLIALTGRVVDLATKAPVSGIMLFASAGKIGDGMDWSDEGQDQENVTDASGRFTIQHAPHGLVTITGVPKDWGEADYGFLRVIRQADGTGTVDVGDIAVVKKRVKHGDPVGDLGLHWASQPDGTPINEMKLVVSWIDPHGPAAKTELKVGDVVTSVDNLDVTGEGFMNAWLYLQAPPGTKITLTVARGASVTVVLAPPS